MRSTAPGSGIAGGALCSREPRVAEGTVPTTLSVRGRFRHRVVRFARMAVRVASASSACDAETGNRSLLLFDTGDEVTVLAGHDGIRFLLVSGKPIEEPVAWRGPIVMNTNAELRQAYAELQDGSFIK